MIGKVLLGLIVTASVASAQVEVTHYGSLSAGYSHFNDADMGLSGTTVGELQFKGGAAIEGAYGVKLDQGFDENYVRLELAGSYQMNDVDSVEWSDGTSDPGSGDVTLMSGMFNVYLDIQLGKGFVPYAMVGLGVAHATVDDGVDSPDDVLFGGQIGGGLGYYLTDHVVLDLGYRYNHFERFEFNDMEIDMSFHKAQFGVRYEF